MGNLSMAAVCRLQLRRVIALRRRQQRGLAPRRLHWPRNQALSNPESPTMHRRAFLHNTSAQTLVGLAVSAGLMPAALAQSTAVAAGTSATAATAAVWPKAAFEGKSLNEVTRALGGNLPIESKDLNLQVPEIAENGNVVRVGVQSAIAGTTMVAVLVEKNPNSLAAMFEVASGIDTLVATNVRMAQSSNVYALAKAGDKYYFSVREVKVTLGGCGG